MCMNDDDGDDKAHSIDRYASRPPPLYPRACVYIPKDKKPCQIKTARFSVFAKEKEWGKKKYFKCLTTIPPPVCCVEKKDVVVVIVVVCFMLCRWAGGLRDKIKT